MQSSHTSTSKLFHAAKENKLRLSNSEYLGISGLPIFQPFSPYFFILGTFRSELERELNAQANVDADAGVGGDACSKRLIPNN
jgi:hypothetical protein